MTYLYVGAMGKVEGEALEAVRDCVRAFGAPVRALELPPADFAYDAARAQYSSTAVLEELLRRRPPDALKLLAITECDLFIPALTFVFGHAQLGGQVGVVSLARLRQEFYGLPPARDVFLSRTAKEALHEAGHLFGLTHCQQSACAMSVASGVRQIDNKQAWFCPKCDATLARPKGGIS